MQLITFAGPPSSGKTSVILKMIMKETMPNWDKHLAENIGLGAPDRFREVLRKTVIPESKAEVSYDSANLWIVIRK